MRVQITEGEILVSSLKKSDFGSEHGQSDSSDSLFVERNLLPIKENIPPVMILSHNCSARSNYTLWGSIGCHSSPHRRVREISVMECRQYGFSLPNVNYHSRNQCSTLQISFSAHIWVFPKYHTTIVMYLVRRIRFCYGRHFCCSFSALFLLTSHQRKHLFAIFHRQKISSKWAAKHKLIAEMDSTRWVLQNSCTILGKGSSYRGERPVQSLHIPEMYFPLYQEQNLSQLRSLRSPR